MAASDHTGAEAAFEVQYRMAFLEDMLTRCRWWFQRLPSRTSVDELTVRGFCLDKQVWVMRWDEMTEVWVETSDKGPEEDNGFLIQENSKGSCRIPSETPVFPNVATALTHYLPDVDQEALMQGLGFGENAEFVVCQRS